MAATLSDYQRQAILQSLKDYGELPIAANAAGITTGYLKRALKADPDFNEDAEHAISMQTSTVVMEAQRRAVQGVPMKDPDGNIVGYHLKPSDILLATLLQAKAEGFSPESRKLKVPNTRPERLRLRKFDDNGKDVSDAAAKGEEEDEIPEEPEDANVVREAPRLTLNPLPSIF